MHRADVVLNDFIGPNSFNRPTSPRTYNILKCLTLVQERNGSEFSGKKQNTKHNINETKRKLTESANTMSFINGHVFFADSLIHSDLLTRSGSRKKYLGGLAPHHLGGNNEQNYCVQLSNIKQLMYNLCTVITLKIWGEGGWARFFWGPVPPWPQHRTATAFDLRVT